jgi:hypothetical protein
MENLLFGFLSILWEGSKWALAPKNAVEPKKAESMGDFFVKWGIVLFFVFVTIREILVHFGFKIPH